MYSGTKRTLSNLSFFLSGKFFCFSFSSCGVSCLFSTAVVYEHSVKMHLSESSQVSSMFARLAIPVRCFDNTQSLGGNAAALLGGTGKLGDVFKTVVDTMQHLQILRPNTKPNLLPFSHGTSALAKIIKYAVLDIIHLCNVIRHQRAWGCQ